MSDVFVSYARSTEPQAMKIAAALRSKGYSVWRDDEIPAHRAYADVIEERLKSSKAVVVIWSADAAKSQWVRSEADAARAAGTLVQISVDGTLPPMPFDQVECAALKGWNGEAEASGWRKLAESVAALVGPIDPERAEGQTRRRGNSICVLPFVNMSGDAEQEYFSDGISDDITTDLSKVSALSVTARNTAFIFKGQAVDVCDIARKLGVNHVLEGSVRKAGGRVRINAQLIDGGTGDHLWAERYDRELDDIFEIQDEISHSIVDALKLRLLPEEKEAIEQRGTTNVEAYNLYLMARQYWITGNWGDTRHLQLVSRICQRALEIDPNYARVWGLLAIVQCILHFTFKASDDDGSAAAERALSLDSDIAEGYAVRARHFYEEGKFAKSDEALAQALAVDPESWEVNREAARIYYFQRRFPEAIRHYEKTVSLDDTDYHSWGMLCSAYEAIGDMVNATRAAHSAVTQSERVLVHDPTNGAALGMGGFGLAVLGQRDRVKEWIDRALLLNPDNTFMRYNFACLMASTLKEAEAAMDLLEPLIPDFSASIAKAFLADASFESLRDHPRFKGFIEQATSLLSTEATPPAAAT